MSFFDSKEEVINIELTQYGKKLLSHGLFKPAYYSFHDDDILYDSLFANFSEKQNETHNRILYKTPFLKPVYTFSDLTFNLKDKIIDKNIKKANVNYLGNSSHNSIYYPSFALNSSRGHIKSVKEHEDESYNSGSFEKIPQINMDTSMLNLFASLKADPPYKCIPIGTTVNYNITSDSQIYEFFDLLEKNCDDNSENFDLEIFIEQEDETTSTENEKKYYWQQLLFLKEKNIIKNNILLDEEEVMDNPLIREQYLFNKYAKYYLDIFVDNEAIEVKRQKDIQACTDNVTATPGGRINGPPPNPPGSDTSNPAQPETWCKN